MTRRPPHPLIPTVLALFTALAACNGSIENESQGESDQGVAMVGDMDTLASDAASSGQRDQTRAPRPARLQIERGGDLVEAGGRLDLGAFKVGERGCDLLKLRNTGEMALALALEVSEGTAITVEGTSGLPDRIEPMDSVSVQVCVDTAQIWSGQVTVKITAQVSIEVTASVEGLPLIALGPQTLQLSVDSGRSWQPVPVPQGLDTIQGALWAKGRAWLFGQGSAPLHTSEDGRTWQAVETAGIQGITALAYGQGKFMGVHERAILHSADGLTWTKVPDTVDEGATLLDIAWGSGLFVAVGDIVLAVSEDGLSWRSRGRMGNVSPITRIVSNTESFAKVQRYYVRVSQDGDQWRTLDVCRDKERSPSAPVFGPGGVMFSWCEGSLYARSLTGGWRRVGLPGVMPTPLTFAQGVLLAIDDSGGFWSSPTGLEWTRAQGDATGIDHILHMGEPLAPQSPPESKGCDGGALKCLDFEQELPTLPPLFHYGLRIGSKNMVAIDENVAFGGKRSMRVDTFAGEAGQRGMITFERGDFDPSLESKIYARMMFFATAYPVYNWHMSETAGPLSPEDSSRVQYNAGGDGARAFHNYYGAGKDCWNKSKYTYPTNEWFCWQIEYDRGANRMVISVNGQEVHRMDGTGQDCLGSTFDGSTVWQAPQFTHLNLGFNPFKTQEQDLTAWIDDIVVDTKPTTCPQKP